ncbi:MAG: beta-galactosidase, partial [Candidatus Limnocylindrales bacterium]
MILVTTLRERLAREWPADGSFLWATGIEDTFIGQPIIHSGRPLDEYVLTQHDRNWRQDLDLASSLGVRGLRYGLPWYRLQPEPDRFDWTWSDEVLAYAAGTLGLRVIIDLVHYGTPGWLEGGFVEPDYPAAVAAYAGAVAERYGHLVSAYT